MAFTTSAPGSKLANVVPFCQIKGWPSGRRLVSLPFSDHCRPLVESMADLCRLLKPIQHDISQEGWQYIEIRPLGMSLDDSANFSRSETFWFHALDLRRGLDEIFRSFHKDCVQRKIQRAEREALTCEQGRSSSLLEKFYGLLLITRRRQGLPPQPIKWFQNLIACVGDALTIRIASKDRRPIAAILTLQHGKTMVFKYGCSDERFNRQGGTQLLLWRAIEEAKSVCLEEFDMGRSDCNNPGLVRFKDRWGAVKSALTYCRYPRRAPAHRPAWALRAAREMLVRMPDSVLTATGKLLYKHVG